MRPIIGITCPWSVETWGDSPEGGGYYYVGKPYVEAVYKYGGIPLLLTPQYTKDDLSSVLEQLLDKVEGILFTGGGDARMFSSESLPTLRKQQNNRYIFEKNLMRKAYNKKVPMLGICRGFQMIVETFGGSLANDTIEGHKQNGPGWEPWHKVIIEKNSKLYNLVGQEEWNVNSFHIQRVDKVPEGFIVSAKAEDGVIEGIESIDHPFLVGFQFHPEELSYKDEKAGRIFKYFINEAKK